MKLHSLVVAMLLSVTALAANAANSTSVQFGDAEAVKKIDVYNDGRNTYIQATPGLVIRGATSDGDRYIIKGVPREIEGYLHGRPLTITQETARPTTPAVNKAKLAADIASRIERLEKEQSDLQKKKAEAEAPPPPKPVFKALVSDMNIRGVMNRWAHELGMQDVVWEIPDDDIPVDREVPFTTDLDESGTLLMQATSFTKHPARTCLHSNGVMRVIPKTRFCDQP